MSTYIQKTARLVDAYLEKTWETVRQSRRQKFWAGVKIWDCGVKIWDC